MEFREFADKYRLKTTNTGAELIAPGKYGELAEINGDYRVRFLAVPRNANMTGRLRNRYRAALAAGLTLKVKSGDAESIFLFDPNDAGQVRLVIKLVRAKVRRIGKPQTREQTAAFKQRMAAARNGLQLQLTPA